MNQDRKGVPLTDEHRKAISDALKGRVLSPEHIDKCRAANKGRQFTQQHRENMRKAALQMSPETRAKMSAAARNRSPETIEKLRQARIGFRHTEEARAKISQACKGRPQSPEAIAKRIRPRMEVAAQKYGVPYEVWSSMTVSQRGNWPRLAQERGQTLAQFIEIQRTKPRTRAALQQVPSIDLQRTHQGELPLAQVQSNFSEGIHSRAA
jgi:hypothetical protein